MLLLCTMFVLHPDGQRSGGSSSDSPLRANLKFWAKLGLYFGAIRLAYVYFGEKGGGSQNQIASQ